MNVIFTFNIHNICTRRCVFFCCFIIECTKEQHILCKVYVYVCMHRSVPNCRFSNWQAQAGKHTMQPPLLPPYAHKIVATTSLSPTIFICTRRTKTDNVCMSVCAMCNVHMANTKEIVKMRNHKAKGGGWWRNRMGLSERNVLLT